MHPDKEDCAICDGVGVLYCSLQGGLLCKPGRKAKPQYIDFDTRAKAAGYVKLEPGECVVKVDQLIEVVAAACEACNKAGVCPGAHVLPMTCCVCASLIAAIDAASKEGE